MLSEPKTESSSPIASPDNISQLCTPSNPSPPQGILSLPEFANSYQLDIISALRGNEHDFLANAAIADAIRAVQSDEDKMELIDFIASEEHGAIALTLENNACKMFNCSPSELPLVSSNYKTKKHFLSELCELFTTSLCQSIPTLFAMLYPLQHFNPNFQIRKIILRHFRDRVLIRLLANFEFGRELFKEDAQLERVLGHMFGLINIEFCDEIEGNKSFDRIYAKFLGNNEIKKEENQKMGSRKVGMTMVGENNERWQMDDEQRKPKALSNVDEKRMVALIESTKSANIGRKERARTMPTKSVSFWDDKI
ncbi:hypothetical protein niasHS_010750 [Heterodera schachtii]|uniref:Uncharacterized protein n=1 Tax=Heterodera schachtii TaxID=97005 RepID=A0ABD2ITM3_HETSC